MKKSKYAGLGLIVLSLMGFALNGCSFDSDENLEQSQGGVTGGRECRGRSSCMRALTGAIETLNSDPGNALAVAALHTAVKGVFSQIVSNEEEGGLNSHARRVASVLDEGTDVSASDLMASLEENYSGNTDELNKGLYAYAWASKGTWTLFSDDSAEVLFVDGHRVSYAADGKKNLYSVDMHLDAPDGAGRQSFNASCSNTVSKTKGYFPEGRVYLAWEKTSDGVLRNARVTLSACISLPIEALDLTFRVGDSAEFDFNL